ncbi:MAG: hypothetical protein GWN29_08010 [Gammaproteobacteria bacterium]|nr:hypothetical protein [Gammaproteobacteria bacterium]
MNDRPHGDAVEPSTTPLRRILSEPLLGFLAIGLGLFVLFEFLATQREGPDARVIVVDRAALLNFVQFRSRAFEPEFAATRLDSMSEGELDLLIEDFVREEALYREALALGMDGNDYIIKQRLIQKVEFINTGLVTAAVELSNTDIDAFFEANKDNYFVDPYVTFTHVFFDNERHGSEQAAQLAVDKLDELNSAQAQFSDAPRHGDRFLYHVNYVERDPVYVASHFGEAMTRSVFELDPDDSVWAGPFESPYGAHLVMLAEKTEGRYPGLFEVADIVRDDARREKINALSDEAIEAIVDTYDVRIEVAPVAAGD